MLQIRAGWLEGIAIFAGWRHARVLAGPDSSVPLVLARQHPRIAGLEPLPATTRCPGGACGVLSLVAAKLPLWEMTKVLRRGEPGSRQIALPAPPRPSKRRRSLAAVLLRTVLMSGTIADHMTPSPHSLEPGHSMEAARRLMRRHQIRHLPIVEDGVLRGVVSQRDLFFLESLDETKPEDILVSEAMTDEVLAVAPDTPVSSVARKMAEKRAGSAIVLDDGKVVGIFTTMDALRILASE